MTYDYKWPDDFTEYERAALSEPTGFPPHQFVGRLDRWCEICDRPDRNLIHQTAEQEAMRLATMAAHNPEMLMRELSEAAERKDKP